MRSDPPHRRAVAARAAGLAAFCLLPARPVRAEGGVAILPLDFGVTEFRGPGSRVAATVGSTDALRDLRPPLAGPLVVVWGRGGGAAVTLDGDRGLATRRFAADGGDLLALERGRGSIPSARLAAHEGLSVTLEDPTRDYPHEALGSPVHARTLVIRERRAAPPSAEPRPVTADIARIPAGAGAVFEDREPRLVDLDGDGLPEVLVVRSDLARGSSLAVIGKREGSWAIIAETPADGEPFRWLNAAAAAAFVPGRAPMIALVRRPDLDGVLQVWQWTGRGLELAAEKAGYSNHAFGSPAQDLAAAFTPADGRARLALPTLDRRSLALLVISEASIEEVARIPLPERALLGVAALGRGGSARILVGLEDGRVAVVEP